ncbi:MAG: hypothetical protein E6K55_06085 [Gemmatimonadetes bacterium]|nr:MAG: hypothetical protein DMD67_06855 [Gemmatimonadota bacterium]PYO99887.1 MAG: hypothetical protein DMD61_05950 [Gemmatimonadota bacterium]TLY54319.1 MAG: hypothetical protein E6K55_06085 [Gemmatimonadota bacterium]
MSTPPVRPFDPAPLLVVTDVAARLVRRGLLLPADASAQWAGTRVLVFREGPVVCEPPARLR